MCVFKCFSFGGWLLPIFETTQVSWIRKRDLHILTAGILTYTSDERFKVHIWFENLYILFFFFFGFSILNKFKIHLCNVRIWFVFNSFKRLHAHWIENNGHCILNMHNHVIVAFMSVKLIRNQRCQWLSVWMLLVSWNCYSNFFVWFTLFSLKDF